MLHYGYYNREKGKYIFDIDTIAAYQPGQYLVQHTGCFEMDE